MHLSLKSLLYILFQLFFISIHAQTVNLSLKTTFSEHQREVWEAQFSPDNSLIVSGGIDSVVKIWNRKDGSLLHNLPSLWNSKCNF